MGLGVSGRLYVGVNLEFARLPVNNSVHAEQFLVVNAVHHEERGITKMAVSAAPCGHCRQFYSELCCAVRMYVAEDSAGHFVYFCVPITTWLHQILFLPAPELVHIP